MPTPSTPAEAPINVPQTPTTVPVGPDGMTEYIRRSSTEIQWESKELLAKLRAEVDELIWASSSPDTSKWSRNTGINLDKILANGITIPARLVTDHPQGEPVNGQIEGQTIVPGGPTVTEKATTTPGWISTGNVGWF